MKAMRYTIAITIMFFLIACEKNTQEFNPLILGEWQLIEIYGEKNDHTLGWIIIDDSHIQTIEFNSEGDYTLATDGNITCNGNFVFESDSILRLKPHDCLPLIESVETIYKLTPDTLIFSNRSIGISSFNLRKDKYIKDD